MNSATSNNSIVIVEYNEVMSIQLKDGLVNQSLDLVLEDLLVRFLINVPDEDLSSIERVFFQVEEAQWFYTDFCRQVNPALPNLKIKAFSTKLLEKCPLIWKWGDPSDALSRFGKYKSTIPVRGVALFNSTFTKVLLVKGTESNSWSFPRGKISKDESDLHCAIREAEEEIGFNALDYVNENEVIERNIKGKNYKIYLASNVPEDYNFKPQSRNEISDIRWHDMKTLQKKVRSNPWKYFIVSTVMKPMLKWIDKKKGLLNEEELKRNAEIKLKALLGLSQGKQNNIDAGRELINILQGVAPKTTSTDKDTRLPYDQMMLTLPKVLDDQAFLLNGQRPESFYSAYDPHISNLFNNNGFVARDGNDKDSSNGLSGILNSLSNIYLSNQPNPESLKKPNLRESRRLDTNSKELLSILKQRVNPEDEKKQHRHHPITGTPDHQASNRSKAQTLLSLFKRDEDGKRDNQVRTNEASKSGEKEGSDDLRTAMGLNKMIKSPIPEDTDKQGAPPKVKILKRPTAGQGSDSLPKSASTSGNDIHNSSPNSARESLNSANSASELLGLLKSKPATTLSSNLKDDESKIKDNTVFSDLGTDSKNFEDFQDFEDFESLNESFTNVVPHIAPEIEAQSDNEQIEEEETHDNVETKNSTDGKLNLIDFFGLSKDVKSPSPSLTANDANMDSQEKKVKPNSSSLLDLLKNGPVKAKTPESEKKPQDMNQNGTFNLSRFGSIYGHSDM